MASEPDSIIEHQPYFCTHCGNDLSDIEGSIIESRQVVDIPMPVRPFVTEHRMIEKGAPVVIVLNWNFPKKYAQEYPMDLISDQ